MIKTCRLIAIPALLLMALLVSGCYTVIGPPSPAEEGVIEGKTEKGQIYRYYGDDYERPYPYYGSSYGMDPYYSFWYPGSYYYGGYYGGGYSRWYNDYNYYPRYYYNDSDYYYLPERKPETQKRGSTEIRRRAPRTENRFGPRIENLEENKPSERRTPNKRKVERGVQRAPEKRRDTSSEKRRSSRRKAEDDEE